MFQFIADSIQNFRFFSDSVDILLVTLMFFYIFKTIEGTRASQILAGIVAVGLLYFVSRAWGFHTLNWLIAHFLGFAILIIVVLFQDDIRKGLANIGKKPLLFRMAKEGPSNAVVDEVVKACDFLSSNQTGAIIVFERFESLKSFPGVPINAVLSSELLISIFNPTSPIHDGGVVIRDDTIASAGSFFPITTNPDFKTKLGTRHRAAMELSRETDAVVVVVSEESGTISVATNGELVKIADNDEDSLRSRLLSTLGTPRAKDGAETKTPAAETV